MLKKSHAAVAAATIVLGAGITATAMGAVFAPVTGPSLASNGVQVAGVELLQGPVSQLKSSIQVDSIARKATQKARAEAKRNKYRDHVLAYSGGGRRWALPYNVAICEGGGRFDNHSGAYGILDSTWTAWGGQKYAPYPGAATPWEQAVITAKVRDDVGSGGWSCWS